MKTVFVRRSWVVSTFLVSAFLIALTPSRAATVSGYTVVGWNNLGMHCMDADYSVFSILPPYNTINAQLINPSGLLVTTTNGYVITYQAIADPTGSINTTSAGKTEFWQFVQPLFGLPLPVDVGLPVPGPNSYTMPGTSNVPQRMGFESGLNWFVAYGIPLTPYDDALNKNAYPMMRVSARNDAGTLLAATDIVLPVSDEMDCRACHASGAGPAALPAAGWVNITNNVQRDYRLNILLLHDDRQAGDSTYSNALATAHFSPAGLYDTAVNQTKPILCAACHLSEALPGTGLPGIKALTAAMHGHHATVVDPTNGLTLDASANRSACYRCHPGSVTRCLRGAMGKAVAPDGSLAMQCQSCHGSMSLVGATARTGWLDEPNCQSCHNGGNRFTSTFDSPGHMRVPADPTFATTPNMPAAGFSLYRFSTGHGGLHCEACHGSTHAEYPSSHPNDNIASVQVQGHVGALVECGACHVTVPSTVNGGPHGMHPVGQSWVGAHPNIIEQTGAAQCQACHGTDYRGTILSRSQADRTISAFGTKVFWRGFQIGCYTCHAGPGSDNANPNHPPVATSASIHTRTNTSLAVVLQATDADKDALTYRIVSQPAHGTVALAGNAATYYSDTDYVGGDSFTFAARDGQTDSNLGTISVTVGASGGCTYALAPLQQQFTAFGGAGSVNVTAGAGCAWTATAGGTWIQITAGSTGTGNGTVKFAVANNPSLGARSGTLTIGGQTFTVRQDASVVDLSCTWSNLVPKCKGTGTVIRCSLKGQLAINNTGSAKVPRTNLAVYLSADSALDGTDTLLKTYVLRPPAPGKTKVKTLSLRLPVGTSATGKCVIALVDPDDAVPDVDDTDNSAVFGPLP